MLKDSYVGSLNAFIAFIYRFKVNPSLLGGFEIPHMIFIIGGHGTLENVFGVCIKLLINLFLLCQVVGINRIVTVYNHPPKVH
jgi:hypothetical protein